MIGAALKGCRSSSSALPVAWRGASPLEARRFTPYELELRARELRRRRAACACRRTVRCRPRRRQPPPHVYETRWGPVFSSSLAGFTWTEDRAYALGDVNAGHLRLVNQWAEYDRAQSVATSAAPTAGCRAIRGRTRSPPTPPAARTTPTSRWCPTSTRAAGALRFPSAIAPLLLGQGVVLLDGSRTGATGTATGCRGPGIIGPKGLPRATRTDDVENSNDSYWLPSARSGSAASRASSAPRARSGCCAPAGAAGRAAAGRHQRARPPGFTLASSTGDVRQPQPQRRAGPRPDRGRVPASAAPTSRRRARCWRRGTCAPTSARAAPCCGGSTGCACRGGHPVGDRVRPERSCRHAARDRPGDTKLLAALTGAVEDLRGKGIALDVPARRPAGGAARVSGSIEAAASSRPAPT